MKNNTSVNNWLYLKTKKFIPYVVVLSILNVLTAFIYIYLAKVSKQVIDNAASSTQKALIYSAVSLLILIILHILFDSASSVISTYAYTKMNIYLRNCLFTQLVRKKYADISEYHSGDLLNRFSSDADVVVQGCIGMIPSVISMLARIIAGIGAICVQNYIFAVIVLAAGLLIPLAGRIISKKYKLLHKSVQQTEGVTRSFLQESFANIVVIKTFGGEKSFYLKLNEYMENNRTLRIKKSVISTAISALLYLFFTAGYYGVLVWGAAKIATGAITIGTLVYFLQLISMLRSPLQNISGVMPKYYAMTASAERLIELENMENEFVETVTPYIINFKTINADNLTFAYDKEIILKNSTFVIERNTITAITGQSGSGKSTLFKLLLGLYIPTNGSLTFDRTTTVDATTRNMFSYVPQGNMIISGTLRENISLCNSSVPEEDIEKAAKAAVIYDFINSLPDKFDTVISEKGEGLSEGQIQRISIARALLFDAPVLLLDEATSALDEDTETQLLKNLKELTDKTIIFITHRNTSLSVCDKILHLENGNFENIKNKIIIGDT